MLRKFLNNNFGFSGYEVLKSQNTGKEIKLLSLIEVLEKKGKALDIIENIRRYCTDDEVKVRFYLMNVMETTLEC